MLKRSNNLFVFKIANNICPLSKILTSVVTETSSDQFETWRFVKIFLYLDILTIWRTLNSGSLSLISWLEPIHELGFIWTRFILIILWYVLLYLLTISTNLSIYTFFDIEVMYLWIFLMNLSAATDFPSLCVEYISKFLFF